MVNECEPSWFDSDDADHTAIEHARGIGETSSRTAVEANAHARPVMENANPATDFRLDVIGWALNLRLAGLGAGGCPAL